MISLNFDIVFRIFGDLVAEFEINELKICCQGQTRTFSIIKSMACMQQHRITDKHAIRLFKIRSAKAEVFCCLRLRIFEAKILFCIQSLVYELIFTIMAVFTWKIRGYKGLEIIRA